jgi:IclR helix-turn-helix domain
MGDSEDRGRVFIQLSEEQVDRVIVANADGDAPSKARGRDSTSGSGRRSDGVKQHSGSNTQWLFSTLMEDRSLSHSLLIGLEVLTCFPLDGTERGVADIASQLGMNNSTVHRYMSTLMRVGLLEQNPYTRLYRLATADGGSRVR